VHRKEVLVTGGAGFIGSEFVRQLCQDKNYHITVADCLTYAGNIDNLSAVIESIDFKKIDIRNNSEVQEIFKNKKFEIVINLAAESHVDNSIITPAIFLETNILGTQNLLDASVRNGLPLFVQISTDEVYGSISTNFASEVDPLNPSSPYSASKAAADLIVASYGKTYNLPYNIIRSVNNYGPFQYPEKLIPFFINRILENKSVPIYGTGKNVREWIHVSDFARAIIEVMENARRNEVFNVASGVFKTNLEVTEFLINTLNRSMDLITYVEDRPGHDFRYALNSEKIRKEIEWLPKVSFEEGLVQTINWYRDLRNREKLK
jgi:dTDP-glucose 4,6-dehydratase